MKNFLKKYEILEKLVEDEFVFAKERALGRLVAVRIIHLNASKGISPKMLNRYVKHLKKVASLEIEGDVSYLELTAPKEKGESAILVMEQLEGTTLNKYLMGNTKINNKGLLKILSNTAKSLRSFHKEGISHCNITPENIFIRKDDSVALLCPGMDDCDDIEASAPSFFVSDIIDNASETYYLGASFISAILKSYSHIFSEYSSTGDDQDEKEQIEELQRIFKVILVEDLVNLLFDMVDNSSSTRPKSLKELQARIKEILENNRDQLLNSPIETNRLIFLPKNKDLDKEFVAENLDVKVRKERKSSKKASVVLDKTDTTTKARTKSRKIRNRKSKHHADDLYNKDGLNRKNRLMFNAIGIVIGLSILVFAARNVDFANMFKKKEVEVAVELPVEVEVESEQLRSFAYAVSQNEDFNQDEIYKRLERIDKLIQKNQGNPKLNSYISKKLELIDIASVSDSEFLVYRVLDDIESEIDSL